MARSTNSLNSEQGAAVESILTWLAAPAGQLEYLLEGSAGTGKTFCMPAVLDEFKGRVVFTAPTNKATRVLRQRLTSDEYKPDCRTTYSLLGLSLQPNGEVRELSIPDEPVDLSSYRLMVVDEASMVGTKLLPHIQETSSLYKLPVLYLGDKYQLPPVGEIGSDVFKLDSGHRSALQTVVRYDNQILKLVTRVRDSMVNGTMRLKVENDNDSAEGVWKYESLNQFSGRFLDAAEAGLLQIPDRAKGIAWRNVTVDAMNAAARYRIFGIAAKEEQWLVGDRVIFTAPAIGLEDERIASTDDEGTITSVTEEWHPLQNDFKIWSIGITLDDNRRVSAKVLHPASRFRYSEHLTSLADKARSQRYLWKDYWAFKELFHELRHAYALTAHRSQGSTYQTAFVDTNDILLNRNRYEAFQCLYVAYSRSAKQLIVR